MPGHASEDPRVILVIDGDPRTRAVLQLTLAQHGFQWLHAVTGVAGVTAALEHEPSVVLLDLGLPDIDGIEVTRRIREHSGVPIIVISAKLVGRRLRPPRTCRQNCRTRR